MLASVEYQIHTIQTDNGSEFKGYFDKAIEELENTKHVWSYPKSPKTNGYVERFNWTIQDEFINYEIDTAVYDIKSFDEKLKRLDDLLQQNQTTSISWVYDTTTVFSTITERRRLKVSYVCDQDKAIDFVAKK